METTKLVAIQQPSQMEALLESFVWGVDILPDGARKVLDRSELPGALRRLATLANGKDKTWGAWTDEHHNLWFLAAEMSLPLSRERGRPVLQVDAYGEDGELTDSACWLAVRDGEWRRCAA